MRCTACSKDAILYQPYSGKHLCPRHLRQDLEAKARRTIRARGWLVPRDHIGIALTGDIRGSALLVFLHTLLSPRRDIRLTAIVSAEGPEDPRGDLQQALAENRGIPVVRVSAGKTAGSSPGPANGITHGPEKDRPREIPFSALLEKTGRELGMTKIATPRSLDDESAAVLTAFLRGEPAGILAGDGGCGGIPLIHPFIAISDREIACYAGILGIRGGSPACHEDKTGLGADVRAMLGAYTGRHPAARYSLVHLADEIRRFGSCPGAGFPGRGQHGGPGGTGLSEPGRDEVNAHGV